MKPALGILMRTFPASACDGSVALVSTTADATRATASLVKRARFIGALLCDRPRRKSSTDDRGRLDLDQIRAHRQHDPEKWIPVFGKDHAQTWRQPFAPRHRSVRNRAVARPIPSAPVTKPHTDAACRASSISPRLSSTIAWNAGIPGIMMMI